MTTKSKTTKSRMPTGKLGKSKMATKELKKVIGGAGFSPGPGNVRPNGPGWLPIGYDPRKPGGGNLE